MRAGLFLVTVLLGCSGREVDLSGEVRCDGCGAVVVAAFDNPDEAGAPLADTGRDGAGPFTVTLTARTGQVWVVAFADGDGAPGVDEAKAVEGPFDVQRDPIDGVVLDLRGDVDPCAAHARDAELATTHYLALDPVADGVADEWPEDDLVADPAGDSDPCDEPTAAGADLLGFSAAEGITDVGFRLTLAGPPDAAVSYVVELHGPSDAPYPGYEIVAGTTEGVLRTLEAAPVTLGEVEVAAAGHALEIVVPGTRLPTLEGWRARVRVSTPSGEDASAFAQLSVLDGVAADDGVVTDPTRVLVVMEEGATEADLATVAAAAGLEVEAFDAALGVGTLRTGTEGVADAAGTPVLNASRAATRAILDRLGAGTHDTILTLQSATFSGSCTVGPSETPLGEDLVLGCVTFDRDTGQGGGSAFSEDPELYHAIDVTWGEDTVAFTFEGTDFSPGPGPSTTTFTGDVSLLRETGVTNGSVYAVDGTFEGGVVLRNPDNAVTDDCSWSGTFAGRLYTTAN